MAIRGPKPTPNATKKLTGSKRVNWKEPNYRMAQNARAPRGHMGKDGLKFWHTYWPILEERGVLTIADLAAFEMMCIHYESFIQVTMQINQEGRTVEDEKGNLRKHPLLQVQRDSSKAWREYALEFGLTPSSRARLKVPEAQMNLAEILFADLDQDIREDE
jgi:P27 family predicted phage terminase small subunit